jgi:predicted nucleic acid-binding protein
VQVTQQEEAEVEALLKDIKPKMDRLKAMKERTVKEAGTAKREALALELLTAVRDELDMDDLMREKLKVRRRAV